MTSNQWENLNAALVTALANGDLDDADRLLDSVAAPLPAGLMATVAELHLRRRRWSQASALLDRVEAPDLGTRLKRNMARNYAALAVHRKREYRVMAAASLTPRHRFVPVEGNRLTIADCSDPAHPVILTPGRDPVAAVHHALKQLGPRMASGEAIGLCGISDGHLFATLAKVRPKLFMDMQQTIHLFEPDFSLMLACFMLHDYSGPEGPIEQARFQWFIGKDWAKDFERALEADLMLPPPVALLEQSVQRGVIGESINLIIESYNSRAAQWKADAQQWYESQSGEERRERWIHAAAACDTPRISPAKGDAEQDRPRVLLLTTRFSTVLQYATRGAAEGFKDIGWDAKVIIEPSPHHRIGEPALREALATFRPDLVFQIDHQRHEHGDLIPKDLPFACWIQDHLPNLTKTQAGRAVGENDFVLTFAAPLFIDTYDYPAQQCVDMPMMLTTPRKAGTIERMAAPDMVYVSNVSQDPLTLRPHLASLATEATRPIVDRSATLIYEAYERGENLASRQDLRTIVDHVCDELSKPRLSADTARLVVETLWNPLNIALYRQQALRWVADAAEDQGLSLGLYGQGWEKHPRFGKYARGVIQHGEPLARLTHSAKINLNLEPYICFTHHRLLDGLIAGGFFLIRSFDGNTHLQALVNLLEDSFDESVQTAAQLLAAAVPRDCPRIADLLAKTACVTFDEKADPVRQVRCMQRAGVLVRQDEAMPHLPDVSFADSITCRRQICRYIGDAPARQAINRAQRGAIENRLSFAAGMRLVVRKIAARFAGNRGRERQDGGKQDKTMAGAA
ncbi:MAG: hypothetical protein WD768_01225 [Phycisphaeraceae bacterium]